MKYMNDQSFKNVVIMYPNAEKLEYPFKDPFQDAYIKRLAIELKKININFFVSVWQVFSETNNTFYFAWALENNEWVKKEFISADLVYDRTGSFKEDNIHLDRILKIKKVATIINTTELRLAIGSKVKQVELFSEWIPKTWEVSSEEELQKVISNYKKELIVAKPIYGYGGYGVSVIKKEECKDIELEYPYLLQEFVSGEIKIPGTDIVGIADIRLVYVAGEFSYSFSRLAAEGSYLTNVAQGATPIWVAHKDVPKKALEIAQTINDRLSQFGLTEISIDFMFEGDRVIVVEVNTKPGVSSIMQMGNETEIQKNINLQIKLIKAYL